jgi:preprotein translocase subunit SecF
MQESSIMEMVKWFLTLFSIVLLVAVAIFCIQLSNVNSYKQQVNYTIERKGGLTKEAAQSLKEYSDKYYNGAFTIESEKLNEKVQYGEIVDYQVIAKFKIAVFNIPDVTMKFTGSASSQIR